MNMKPLVVIVLLISAASLVWYATQIPKTELHPETATESRTLTFPGLSYSDAETIELWTGGERECTPTSMTVLIEGSTPGIQWADRKSPDAWCTLATITNPCATRLMPLKYRGPTMSKFRVRTIVHTYGHLAWNISETAGARWLNVPIGDELSRPTP